MNTIFAHHNYGPLKKGCVYTIISEGRDYYAIKTGGSVINVPFWVFDR